MQLKLKRSQREGGVISTNVIFCLDARVALTPEESENIRRYKLHNQVIYNSEASRRLLDRGEVARTDGSTRGALKSLAYTALAAMRLNISVNSLTHGQHIECKSLDELLAAEEAIYEACENLRLYLDTAATFDGREVVFDFVGDKEVKVVAQAVPAKKLVDTPGHPVPQPVPALEHASAPVEDVVLVEPQPDDRISTPPTSYDTGSFFSEGEEGEQQKKILIGIGGAVLVLLLTFSCMT